MKFDLITQEHINAVVKEYRPGDVPPIKRTKVYAVMINGQAYPVKFVIQQAYEKAYGEKLTHKEFNSLEARKYLARLHFIITPSAESDPNLESIVSRYISLVKVDKNVNEVYKWKLLKKFRSRPSIEALDFDEEIKQVDFKNLIFHNARASMLHMAREQPESYRACFYLLFDETKSLAERVNKFNEETLRLYRQVYQSNLSHHHDERTIATILSYHQPESYPLYKKSFYKKLCDCMGVKAAVKNNRYVHYIELLHEFIEEYIEGNEELLELKNSFLDDDCFDDQNNLLLAQDILYRVLDKGREELNIAPHNFFKVSLGQNIFSREDVERFIDNRTIAINEYTNAKGTSTVTQAELFARDMQIGDYFYLTHGNLENGIKLIGRITTDSHPARVYDKEDKEEWLEREFEIVFKSINQSKFVGTQKWWTPNDRSTIAMIKQSEFDLANKLIFNKYFNVQVVLTPDEDETDIMEQQPTTPIQQPLNTILYGPPGTGKTYHTINRAIAIANPGFDLTQNRSLIKEEFERLKSNKQVEFITFHQSMSYEDFIEGLKPKLDQEDDTEQIAYEIKEGIFKKLANKARGSFEDDSTAAEYSFEDAWYELVKECSTSGGNLELSSLTLHKGLELTGVTDHGNLKLKPKSSKDTLEYTVSYNRARKLQEAYPDLTAVKNIEKEFRAVIGGSNATAYWAVLNYLRDKMRVNASTTSHKTAKLIPHVLIIDEINRGNISQIFGELITLIEDDKRQGKAEALEVTLPYSEQKFSVPSNVYIVGTMNTADRSVEALDTALRRRFVFEEMPSNPALIATEGKLKATNGVIDGKIDLVELLKTVNQRIEKLLDKDHQIGHAFFMQVSSMQDLIAVFEHKIIPLLREYFYGDYGKIGLVLGASFMGKEQDPVRFASFEHYDGDMRRDYESKIQFRFTPKENWDFQNIYRS